VMDTTFWSVDSTVRTRNLGTYRLAYPDGFNRLGILIRRCSALYGQIWPGDIRTAPVPISPP
jgi:hypothetical protein